MQNFIPSRLLTLFGLIGVILLTLGNSKVSPSYALKNFDYSVVNNGLRASPSTFVNTLKVNLKGSLAGGNYSHFEVQVNDQYIGDHYSTSSFQIYEFDLPIEPAQVESIKIIFDNDAVINGQDRNLFVQSISINSDVIDATSENVTYKNNSGTLIPYNGVMPWNGELIFNISKKWKFSVVAGITQETANNYGGLNTLKNLISNQFNTINAKFNNPKVFNSIIEFSVDSIYIFSGDVDEEISKDHPGFDYRLVIDGYPQDGGGWLGGYNAIYHSWSVNSFGGPFGGYGTDALTHEWGHSRGAIDLYALEVLENNNPINNQEYKIPFESIMNSPYGIDRWDEHSISLINLTGGEVIQNTAYILGSFPSKMGVKTVDQAGQPLKGVKINYYPKRWGRDDKKVEEVPLFTLQTDQTGIAYLNQNPFMPNPLGNDAWHLKYCNFLIEAIYGDKKIYKWMPLFEVQNHFFQDEAKPYLKSFSFSNQSDTHILEVTARGSEANGEFAHFKLFVDNIEVGHYLTSNSFINYKFPLSNTPSEVRIVFDNDAVINGQDRNLFVQSISLDGETTNATSENVIYKNNSGTVIPYNGVMPWNGELIFDITTQSCQGDVILSSQAEIDAFDCQNVLGNLTISGSNITNLNGLSGLLYVEKNLMIKDNPMLVNLDGLNALERVGNGLQILENSELKKIDGLSSLSEVSSDLTIGRNSSLTNINGLQSLIYVWSLSIYENDLLENVDALSSVSGIEFLNINENNSLRSLSGFNQVNSFSGKTDVNISNNNTLDNVDFLTSLKLAYHLTIKNNSALKNLDGLLNLRDVYLDLTITNNTNLIKCCGLYPLFTSGGIVGTTDLSGNGAGCTKSDIISGGHCLGELEFIVTLKGSEAGGQHSHFLILINDEEIVAQYSTSSYQSYLYGLAINPNLVEKVQIVFDNDAVINGSDRNLYVQSISLNGMVIPASSQNVTYKNNSGAIIPYNWVMPWNGVLTFENISFSASASSRKGNIVEEKLDVKIDHSESFDFNLYPNPGNGLFTLVFDNPVNEPIAIEIIDYTGKMIFQNEVTLKNEQNLEIDLMDIPSGIYLLKFSNKEQILLKRLIKN